MTLPIYPLLVAELAVQLPVAVRLQRVVSRLRAHFSCGAVALLQLEEGTHLRPVAVDGLTSDALGRRFGVESQPRLAAILQQQSVVCFDHDSPLPDPYDGLVAEQESAPLPVHDCMGIGLNVDGERWGVLTLDALEVGTFTVRARAELAELVGLVEAAIRVTRLEAENQAMRQSGVASAVASTVKGGEEVVGQSEAMRRLLHELSVVADSELPVLLLGETGVGKELFAHRIHRLSRRAKKPLVHVNCAALPESLAESELFGHVKGAFSGAVSDRPGRFEAAEGGTLFLDEVGELPLSVQAKLLRTLQNGEIQRLGADTPLRVDVRVIAATNRSLRDHVRDGSFRADLYHRLSVYPIPIPPLRERGNDILILAGRFLEANRARLGLRSVRLSAEAEQRLLMYHWPGNVRELEHVVSRAALKAVSRGADRREIVTLEAELLDLDAVSAAPLAVTWHAGISPEASMPMMLLRDIVDNSQRHAIQQALSMQAGNWAAAARQLGLDASNLHKLARRLGVKAP